MAKGLFIGITFGVVGAVGMASYYLSKFKNRSKYIQDEKQINEDFKTVKNFESKMKYQPVVNFDHKMKHQPVLNFEYKMKHQPVLLLNEICPCINYIVTVISNPPPVVFVECIINGQSIAAQSSSKKEAKKMIAIWILKRFYKSDGYNSTHTLVHLKKSFSRLTLQRTEHNLQHGNVSCSGIQLMPYNSEDDDREYSQPTHSPEVNDQLTIVEYPQTASRPLDEALCTSKIALFRAPTTGLIKAFSRLTPQCTEQHLQHGNVSCSGIQLMPYNFEDDDRQYSQPKMKYQPVLNFQYQMKHQPVHFLNEICPCINYIVTVISNSPPVVFVECIINGQSIAAQSSSKKEAKKMLAIWILKRFYESDGCNGTHTLVSLKKYFSRLTLQRTEQNLQHGNVSCSGIQLMPYNSEDDDREYSQPTHSPEVYDQLTIVEYPQTASRPLDEARSVDT